MLALPFAGSCVLAPPEPSPLAILNPAAERAWREGRPVPGLAFPDPGPDAPWPASPAVAASGPERRRVYGLCGQPVEVRFAPPELEALVAGRFGPYRDATAPPVATIGLTRTADGYAVSTPEGTRHAATAEAALGGLVRCIVEISHPATGWRAVVHAAAVTWDDRAVLLPGGNGSGKSTLVAGLLAAGCGYLSDDCAPISRDGEVVPVPFALCLKSGSWDVAAPYVPGLAEAPIVEGPGGRPCRYVPVRAAAAAGVAPGLVVFPRYVRGARLEVRPLDPVETLTRLVEGGAWFSRDPGDIAASLAQMERLPAHALDFGDLDQAVGAVLDLAA